MNPAASSLASSFLMASLFSAENLRRRCFLAVTVGLTFRECSVNSLGTPGISAGFQANTSRLALRKLTSALSYLSVSPVLIKAVFYGSPSCSWIVLTSTLSGGFGAEEFAFFVGISIPDAESCLAAASTSPEVSGRRLVEVYVMASFSHSNDFWRSPRNERTPVFPGILSSK